MNPSWPLLPLLLPRPPEFMSLQGSIGKHQTAPSSCKSRMHSTFFQLLCNTRRHTPIGSEPFSRRFREGSSFPNFVERSFLELPLSKLCAVPFVLQNRALFERERRAKRCRENGRKRGGQPRGQKGKKDT